MDEWTEQEEQQIIERAKTGDPEANYALSLWALRRSEEEPDEPRWNRLAAKCLVKAAQAGYGPAKEQMAALLNQSSPAPAPARQSAPPADPEPQPQPRKRPVVDDEDEDVDDSDVKRAAPIRRSAPAQRAGSVRRSVSAARPAPSARRPAARRQDPRDEEDEGFDTDEASWDDGYYDDEEDARPARRGFLRGSFAPARRDGGSGGGKWGDDKWRRLEIICVAVCTVLLVVIAALIISGKRDGSSGSGGDAAIPPAGEVGTAGGVTAGDYPDEATKNAIMAADLDIFPAQEDYETQQKTGKVSVNSASLRVRKGPNTTYEELAQLPNDSSVSILAKKNDWDLILYQGDEGPIYGWCSSGYIIELAGAAATNAPGDVVG